MSPNNHQHHVTNNPSADLAQYTNQVKTLSSPCSRSGKRPQNPPPHDHFRRQYPTKISNSYRSRLPEPQHGPPGQANACPLHGRRTRSSAPRDTRYPEGDHSYPAISARIDTTLGQYIRMGRRRATLRIELKRAQFLILRTFSSPCGRDSSLRLLPTCCSPHRCHFTDLTCVSKPPFVSPILAQNRRRIGVESV